jgi:hypothetical protein
MRTRPQLPETTKSAKNKAVTGSFGTSKGVNTLTTDLPYDVISSFRLKRTKPKPQDQLIKMLIDSEDFKQVQLLGVKYGVTFCEVFKGLLNRELADVNNGSTLSHFIPVLQV